MLRDTHLCHVDLVKAQPQRGRLRLQPEIEFIWINKKRVGNDRVDVVSSRSPFL